MNTQELRQFYYSIETIGEKKKFRKELSFRSGLEAPTLYTYFKDGIKGKRVIRKIIANLIKTLAFELQPALAEKYFSETIE